MCMQRKYMNFMKKYSVRSVVEALIDLVYTLPYRGCFAHIGKRSRLGFRAMSLIGLKHISIGERTFIGAGVQLSAWECYHGKHYSPSVQIGNRCRIRENCHITAVNSITIGNGVLTGTNVLITDNSHGESSREQMALSPVDRPLFSKGPVRVGNNVWLGNNVCVMPGVTIGDGVVVGANSVVTHDLPAYCVAAGIPARVIKQL